jgi:hypothetical protein
VPPIQNGEHGLDDLADHYGKYRHHQCILFIFTHIHFFSNFRSIFRQWFIDCAIIRLILALSGDSISPLM